MVRVTDSVPGLPLRVPNELAHLFATTHNNVQLFPLPAARLAISGGGWCGRYTF